MLPGYRVLASKSDGDHPFHAHVPTRCLTPVQGRLVLDRSHIMPFLSISLTPGSLVALAAAHGGPRSGSPPSLPTCMCSPPPAWPRPSPQWFLLFTEWGECRWAPGVEEGSVARPGYAPMLTYVFLKVGKRHWASLRIYSEGPMTSARFTN